MADIQAPEVIGSRYQLLAQLGRGGMGVVYQARDRLTQQLVALKRVEATAAVAGGERPDIRALQGSTVAASTAAPLQTDAPAPELTLQGADRRHHLALAHEFRTLASLRHPHIVSVLDYGFVDRQPYFTMEYLPGCKTLRDAAAPELKSSQRIWLIAQVLLALSYLHRRGILHRDVGTANSVRESRVWLLRGKGVERRMFTARPRRASLGQHGQMLRAT